MSLISIVKREIKFISTSKRMLGMVASVDADSENLLTDDLEHVIDQYPNNTAFITKDRQWSYREFDDYANRIAHWARANGLKRGDSVAIFSHNRLEYVALWFGFSKIGVSPALLNYQLRAEALAHCVNISGCQWAIIDYNLRAAWKSAVPHLSRGVNAVSAFGPVKSAKTLEKQLETQPKTRPARDNRAGLTAKDELMKMFTSGTTGLPKAAKIAHTKAQYYMRGFVIPSETTPDDRMMMVLPLYHATGGLCGVGAALMRGAAVIVLEKFSVSSFWKDACHFKATHFMYVGELCRFLLNADPDPNERAHQIRCIIGNGLRPEVWTPFVERFNIDKVVEFYGATEGNISLINYSGKVGAVGRVPWYFKFKFNGEIVRYDVEQDRHPRKPNGFLFKTGPGEVGELIGEIRPGETRFRYDGYENKEASEKKVLHDAFKKGDQWFRTGDLFWRDRAGYYYFADRVGDTYRWKAENISTNEVAGAISACPGVEQANVYGVHVPGHDGKAGMAALTVEKGFDLAVLHALVEEALPSYARPVFLRLSKQTDTTTTFKYKKTDLVRDGYDPSKISDPIYVSLSGEQDYKRMNAALFQQIENGDIWI